MLQFSGVLPPPQDKDRGFGGDKSPPWKVQIHFNGKTFTREFASESDALYAHADLLGDLRGAGPLKGVRTLRPDGSAIRTTTQKGDWPEDTPDA